MTIREKLIACLACFKKKEEEEQQPSEVEVSDDDPDSDEEVDRQITHLYSRMPNHALSRVIVANTLMSDNLSNKIRKSQRERRGR